MGGPRLLVAVLFLSAAAGGIGLATLQAGRMARALGEIERRPRPFWQPLFVIWRDYHRLCPGGPLLRGMAVAVVIALVGAAGFTLCLA